MEAADLVVINTCAIREAAEQKVIGRQGHLAPAQGRQPGAARRPDRLLRARAGSGRPAAALPGRRPVPAPRRGAGARRSARAGVGARRPSGAGRAVGSIGATTIVGRTVVGVADGLPATRARAVGGGDRRPRLGDQRLAADHLRLRQDLHLLHRAVQPRSGAQPAVRRDRRRGARARRGRLPRGHAPRPERQLVRPRPRARAALRPRRRRALGGPPARPRTGARTSPSSSARSTGSGPPTGGRRSRASAS